MPGTTSTALPSFSHDQHHKTGAAKQKGGIIESKQMHLLPAGLLHSNKLRVLNLLTGRKSAFLPAEATHCTDSHEIWHMGPLGRAKFHATRCRGWECDFQNGKKFTLFGRDAS